MGAGLSRVRSILWRIKSTAVVIVIMGIFQPLGHHKFTINHRFTDAPECVTIPR
jgi:hypothetical protein